MTVGLSKLKRSLLLAASFAVGFTVPAWALFGQYYSTLLLVTIQVTSTATLAAVTATSLAVSGLSTFVGISNVGTFVQNGAFTTVSSSSMTINGALGATGATTLAGAASVGSTLTLGDSAQANLPGIRYEYAKSIDGATQSAGCMGLLSMQSVSASAVAVWTSTTSAPAGPGNMLAILNDASCAPGAVCKFQVHGTARVVSDGNTTTPIYAIISATRCRVNQSATITNGQSFAIWISTKPPAADSGYIYIQ